MTTKALERDTMTEFVTEAEVDAGARVLRARQQGGKKLRAWESLPKSAKKKWIDHAESVLIAALCARKQP